MRFSRTRVGASVLVVGLGIATGCSPGLVANKVAPKTPDVAEAMGQAPQGCTVAPKIGQRLVVDWNDAKRKSLDESLRQGSPVVVHYDCSSLEVLPQCEVTRGKYGYMGLSPSEHKVELKSASELAGTLPLGAATFKAEFKAGTQLNVLSMTVGSRVAPFKQLSRKQLAGDCAAATHFIYSAKLGAFSVETGVESKIGGGVAAMGASVEGSDSTEKKTFNSSGDRDACKGVKSDATTPPEKCDAPVQIDLFALTEEDATQGEGLTETGTANINPCPPSMTFKEGKCTPVEKGRQCEPGEFDDCERQCKLGHPGSCVNVGRIYAFGINHKRDPRQAEEPFTTACDQDDPKGCLNLAWLFAKGFDAKKRDQQRARVAARKAGYLLQDLCRGDDAEACYLTGTLLGPKGYGVPDNKLAGEYLEKGCEAGFAESCAELASDGFGKGPNERLALLKRSCAGGFSAGCYRTALELDKRIEAAKKNRKEDDEKKAKGKREAADEDSEDENDASASAPVPTPEDVIEYHRKSCEGGYPLGCKMQALEIIISRETNDETKLAAKDSWGRYLGLVEASCKNGKVASDCALLAESLNPEPTSSIATIMSFLDIKPDRSRAGEMFEMWSELVNKDCENSIVDACIQLHNAYKLGTNGKPKRPDVATLYFDQIRKLWEPECGPENTGACLRLASFSMRGYGSPDPLSLRHWLHTACVSHDYRGCLFLGMQYAEQGQRFVESGQRFQQSLERDLVEAQTWLSRACEGNYSYQGYNSCEQLALLLEKPGTNIHDPQRALALHEHVCAEGNYKEKACRVYEQRLQQGAAQKSATHAAHLFAYNKQVCTGSKLANQRACNAYEQSLRDGNGIGKDQIAYFNAVNERCTQKGHPDACATTGTLLHTGSGVSADKKAAEDRFNRACGPNLISVGCNIIGSFYEKAKGADKDVKKAGEYYRRGCRQLRGNTSWSESCNNLARLQQTNALGKTDSVAALKTLKFSCNYGTGDWRTSCQEFKKLQKKIPTALLPPELRPPPPPAPKAPVAKAPVAKKP
jgi:TPR repeat protein